MATPVFTRTALTNSLEWIYAVLCVALTLLLSCSCTVDFKMSLNDFDFTATCIHYKTVLLPNSSTYKFQPCCRYWQIPVLANSIPVLFTDTFQYLQILPLLPLLPNSLPANSVLDKNSVLLSNSSTCKFLLSVFTVRIQYLQFPLLANSYNPTRHTDVSDPRPVRKYEAYTSLWQAYLCLSGCSGKIAEHTTSLQDRVRSCEIVWCSCRTSLQGRLCSAKIAELAVSSAILT